MSIKGSSSFDRPVSASDIKCADKVRLDISAFLSAFPEKCVAREDPVSYFRWLHRELQKIPGEVLSILQNKHLSTAAGEKASAPDCDEGTCQCPYDCSDLFSAVAEYLRENSPCSINQILDQLIQEGRVLKDPSTYHDLEQFKRRGRNLIFGTIGWLSSLYVPDLTESTNTSEFCLANTLERYEKGQCIISRRNPHTIARYELSTMFKYFGFLLWPKNACLCDEGVEKAAFNDTSILGSKDLNFAFLEKFLGISISWVDSLAAHMEFDPAAGVLFLYRFPSFCAKNMATLHQEGYTPVSVLECCADLTGTDVNWMKSPDVRGYLKELLMSYRLLFGQEKDTRRIFRYKEQRRVAIRQPDTYDPLLEIFCSRKRLDPAYEILDREASRLHRDFPYLRCRIAVLKRELSAKKARTWRDLWRDNRDTSSWYTFWAVIFFGGIGTILAIVQTILAALQVAQGK